MREQLERALRDLAASCMIDLSPEWRAELARSGARNRAIRIVYWSFDDSLGLDMQIARVPFNLIRWPVAGARERDAMIAEFVGEVQWACIAVHAAACASRESRAARGAQ